MSTPRGEAAAGNLGGPHDNPRSMSTRYAPVVDGFSQRGAAVHYGERPPPQDLADVVHVFWELRTLQPLPADFLYHAVPDACVKLLFNRLDVEVAGVTSLHTVATTTGSWPVWASTRCCRSWQGWCGGAWRTARCGPIR
jgi:hypothetical protein